MGKTIMLHGFASAMTVEQVKEFLEDYTGQDTVAAVRVVKKEGSRGQAKVQFKTMEDVERILSWTENQVLWHNDSYLRAWTLKQDIIKQPKETPQFSVLHSIDDLMLHFGCQVSKDKFSVLWNQAHVSFKFAQKLDRLYFFLTYNSVDYKLELLNDNVRHIVLHNIPDQTKKCLLIQVCSTY